MSSYIQGLLTGAVLVFSVFIFMGQQELEQAEQIANNGLMRSLKHLRLFIKKLALHLKVIL